MYIPQTTGSAQKMPFLFLWWPYMMKFQNFPYHENYISYILNWLTFQNVYIYIYIYTKWAKIRISGLLLNENFRTLFET